MPDQNYLFVYGTLRKDIQNKMHRLLSENADFIQKGTFRGKLFMIRGYPGAVPSSDPDDLVHGEVYRLRDPESILSRLDAYEGCSHDCNQPTEYVRKKYVDGIHYIYTMWKTWQDHDDFHIKQFDLFFELCGHCLSMVIEGATGACL